MQPMTVVKHGYIVQYVLPGFVSSLVMTPLNSLLFQAPLQPTTFLEYRVNNHRQIEPAFLRPEVSDITHIRLVWLRHLKVSIQYIVKHQLFMVTVRRDLIFIPEFHLNFGFLHQLSSLVTTNRVAQGA